MNTQIEAINHFLGHSRFFYTIAVDMKSNYSYVSENYDRNFSFGKGTLKGQPFSVTLHPEDISLCANQGQKCFESPEKLVPITLRKHDGRGGYVTTRWEMQAIFNEDGSPNGIFCIGYNITEMVLIQSKLETASNQLGEIGFIQSHLVRRPLANILGLTDLIVNHEPGNVELVNYLQDAAHELDLIIQQISDKTHLKDR